MFEWNVIKDKYDIHKDGKTVRTSRMRIPEGWLYLHIQIQLVNGQIIKSESMAFVPSLAVGDINET